MASGSGNGAANVSAINGAFSADAGGSSPCVINLPAGTYYMSGSLVFSYQGAANVVVRGAGANSTFLIWNGAPSSNCNGLGPTAICLINGDSSGLTPPGNSANIVSWTGGYSKGATSITISGFGNLKVGSLIGLWQNDPSSDNGNWWPCATSLCSQAGGLTQAGKSQIETIQVTGCGTTTPGAACTSGTITLARGLDFPNWSSGQSPQAGWSGNLPISNVGFENFSMDESGITLVFAYMFHNAFNDWVTGVRSINGTVSGQAAHEHWFGYASSHITVRDNYFYGSNPNAEGYGMSPSAGTDDSLFQNNICQHIASCFVSQTAVGSVFGYNYAIDNYFGSGWQQCDIFHHGAGDSYNLYEGNVGTCSGQDSLHGTAFANTYYRNALSGWDAAASTPPGGQVLTINLMAFARYMNLLNNVLGYGGHSTSYQYIMSSATDCGPGAWGQVYAFGDSDQNIQAYQPCQGPSGPFNDVWSGAKPSDSAMRWYNWDGFNSSVQANTAELACSANTYPGLCSPATTFPCSFYLSCSAAPSWWHFTGAVQPFPATGSDRTGGNISGSGGLAGLNPAADNFIYKMLGSTTGPSGPLAFDPSVYYTGGGTPQANTPTLSPSSGTPPQTVTISCSTSGSIGCYTLDGSSPTAPVAGTCSGGTTQTYSTPISITANPTTLNGLCTAVSYLNSGVTTSTYSGSGPTCGDPSQLGPPANPSYYFSNTYPSTDLPMPIGFSSPTSGCVMHYTSDGSAPTCSSATYPSGGWTLTVAGNFTYRVIACQGGYTSSHIQGGTWTITTMTPPVLVGGQNIIPGIL